MSALVSSAAALLVLVPSSAARADPTLAEIQQKITKASTTLSRVVEDYNKVTEQLKQTRAAIARHGASLPRLQDQLSTAQQEVSHIAKTAYQTGTLREFDAVLNASPDTGLLDRLAPLEQLSRRRQAQLTGFTTARREYSDVQENLNNLLAKQAIQHRDLTARKVKIEKDLATLFALRREAYGQAEESGSRYTGKVPAVSGKAGVAVRYAYGAIGARYTWGGEGSGGYDCSGLTKAAWRAAGRSLPHNAAMQWDDVAHIRRSQLMPGDLVFYSGLGHVGIYVGSGNIIHAPTFGQRVKLADVDMMSPYGYGRVR